MKNEYSAEGYGDVSVNNEVIKDIALKAATEVGGIYAVKCGFLKKLWNAITGKSPAHGVKLYFSGDSEVGVALTFNIEYGTNISDAAGEAQERVKNAVENMTGLTVTEVTVKIAGMHPKNENFLKEG